MYGTDDGGGAGATLHTVHSRPVKSPDHGLDFCLYDARPVYVCMYGTYVHN